MVRHMGKTGRVGDFFCVFSHLSKERAVLAERHLGVAQLERHVGCGDLGLRVEKKLKMDVQDQNAGDIGV